MAGPLDSAGLERATPLKSGWVPLIFFLSNQTTNYLEVGCLLVPVMNDKGDYHQESGVLICAERSASVRLLNHCARARPDWIGIDRKLKYDVVVPLGFNRRNTRVASVRAAWR